jgi:hypothetical protein
MGLYIYSHVLNSQLTNFIEQNSFLEAYSPQILKQFPCFMKPEGSLPHSQQPATCPCPEPDQSSRCPHIPCLVDPFNIILPCTPGFSKLFLFLRFPHQIPVCSSALNVLHILTISFFLIWSSEWYLVRSTEHKSPCYVVFSFPTLPHWAMHCCNKILLEDSFVIWTKNGYKPANFWRGILFDF